MTFPIIPPDAGGVLDPLWAQEVTDAVNDHESFLVGLGVDGGWVGYEAATANTSSSTSVTIGTVSADLIGGYMYLIRIEAGVGGTEGVVFTVTLREDSSSGAEIDAARDLTSTVDGTVPNNVSLGVLYQPAEDETKTFVAVLTAASNVQGVASATNVQLFTIDLVSTDLDLLEDNTIT